MRSETWAGLETCITGGLDREGSGIGPVVVLMHGFGAPGDDLVSLWRMLDVPAETRFVFPTGPLSLNLGFGESRAWWMLDMDRLTQERTSGNWKKLAKEVPTGLQQARDQLLRFLDNIQRDLTVQPGQIVLGGFSQGAMLACDVVLRTDQPFAGLILLSGTVIAEDEWQPLMAKREGLPVFQSHGFDDPLLSFNMAQQLRDSLLGNGLQVDWHEFRGGHEIPVRVLEQLGLFVKRTLY